MMGIKVEFAVEREGKQRYVGSSVTVDEEQRARRKNGWVERDLIM